MQEEGQLVSQPKPTLEMAGLLLIVIVGTDALLDRFLMFSA